MKKYLKLIALSALLFAACHKSENTTTTPQPAATPSPYYFNFKLDTATHNISGDNAQYMTFYASEAGGYQVPGNAFFPSIGLGFDWPSDDTVSESDMLALAGKTFHFNDTAPHPFVTFSSDAVSSDWYSEDTANSSFFVTVTKVTFLKNDTTLGMPIRTYVVTGTCSAVMNNGTAQAMLTGGTFNMIMSRQNH